MDSASTATTLLGEQAAETKDSDVVDVAGGGGDDDNGVTKAAAVENMDAMTATTPSVPAADGGGDDAAAAAATEDEAPAGTTSPKSPGGNTGSRYRPPIPHTHTLLSLCTPPADPLTPRGVAAEAGRKTERERARGSLLRLPDQKRLTVQQFHRSRCRGSNCTFLGLLRFVVYSSHR